MDSYQAYYKASFIWHRTMAKFVQHDFYDWNFKPGTFTKFLYALMAFLIYCLSYTVYYYDNFTRLNCVLYFGLLVQAATKMYNIRYCRQFIEKLDFIRILFKMHISTKSKVRLELFKRFGFYNTTAVKVAVFLYSAAGASYYPYPIYMYYFQDQFVPLMVLYVPGIDEKTVSGYICLLIFHACVIILTVIGMGVCDILVTLCIINIPIFSRLIEDEIDQLNEVLDENKKSAENTRTWKYRLRNLFVMHQEMAVFLWETDEMFHKITLAQIGTLMLGSIPLIFVVLTHPDYIPGYNAALYTLSGIFFFCTFGHIIEESNAISEDAVMNINWYLMGMKEQKMYVHFLTNVQNPYFLTIGGLFPLNWPTCVQLFKSIYYWTNILRTMH